MTTILGYEWEDIQRAQLTRGGTLPRRVIDTTAPGDYGADPVGDGTFRMVPSGDIVTYEERQRRLGKA